MPLWAGFDTLGATNTPGRVPGGIQPLRDVGLPRGCEPLGLSTLQGHLCGIGAVEHWEASAQEEDPLLCVSLMPSGYLVPPPPLAGYLW